MRAALFILYLLSFGGVGFAFGWLLKPEPPVAEPAAPTPFRFYELGALTQPYFRGGTQVNPSCPGPASTFIFSPDACPDLYGVDLSHHDQDFDFEVFKRGGVEFAHIRATHGETIVDRRLQTHAKGLIEVGIPFATYHFFSSLSDPRAQAVNYLDAIAFLAPNAMLPPVLDMEWDIPASDPGAGDRWADLSPREIADRMETWLAIVEENTGVKPMIYTNTRWWNDRLGNEGLRFKDYTLWIARYGQFDRDMPDLPEGFDAAFWQFTEDARIEGIDETFNGSKLNPEFARRALGAGL